MRVLLLASFCLSWLLPSLGSDEPIRIGIVGLDTSHVIAFTKQFNDPDNPKHVRGGRVVAAYKGGSPDIASSADRIDGFTETLVNDFGVTLYEDISSLCQNVDAILLESVDGRKHLEQARPIFEAGLPVFIDKPVAGSLRDAIKIFQLAEDSGTPCWSASSLRFRPGVASVASADAGEVRGAFSYGPASIEPTHPDLFWYGIHPTEALFTVLGSGCISVVRTHTDDTDIVTGIWKDGKVGVVYGQRNQKTGFKVIKFGTKKIVEQAEGGDYTEMLEAIIDFFKTGHPPVSAADTLEIYAFMEAADESKRRNGAPVTLEEVFKMARP
tara:strand:+ start:13758 stop:14735 length:978 start_codon:yes stop_codon:yes gene_type:complete